MKEGTRREVRRKAGRLATGWRSKRSKRGRRKKAWKGKEGRMIWVDWN